VLALVVVADAALIVFSSGVLIHSSSLVTVMYQGDIVLPASDDQRGPDFSKPFKSVYCSYWDGFRIKRIDGRRPCPLLMR